MHTKSLNKELIISLKWYKKLTGKFIKSSVVYTIIVIVSTLFSQLSVFLSSLMPLKIIMILGSNKIPKYFPDSWKDISIDMLIIYLGITSVMFFLLHLMFEKIIIVCSEKGSLKILNNNNKIILFENQDKFAQKSYAKQLKSLSNIIFFLLALVGLYVVYPLLCVLILFFILIVYFIFVKMYSDEKLSKQLSEKFGIILNLIRNIVFFIVFAFILGSFISDFYPPHILVVIISILLIKQMLSKLNEALKDIVSLYKNRVKINSIFFFSQANIQISHDKVNKFWNLFENKNKQLWIEKLLNKILDIRMCYIDSEVYKLNIKNIMLLKVTMKSENHDTMKTYIVKVFNNNVTSQALLENTFFENYKDNVLSLNYLGSTFMEEFPVNIFEYLNINSIPQEEFAKKYYSVVSKIMAITPNKDLLERYSRSHSYLYKRLDKNMCKKLYLTADSTEQDLVKRFEYRFDIMIQKLEHLPLQIINPLITKFTLVQKDANLSLIHWGTWKIDSLGIDYSISINSLEFLKNNFIVIAEEREEFSHVQVNDVILAAYLSNFEKLYNSENFTAIFDLIPKILKSIEE